MILASYPAGSEKAAVDRMREFWLAASTTYLYENWFGGIARGMFEKGGLYDSAPMKKFLIA